MGAAAAQVRLAALVSALTAARYETLSLKREFVVHDTDESIDAGWIAEEGVA
ncbi:hypothetical protein [Nocardia sp. Marseille-Q1738]